MANETELNELRERIGKLPLSDQLHLFEMVLGDYRRNEAKKRAETQAELLAMLEVQRTSEFQRALAAPFTFPPEAKREAG